MTGPRKIALAVILVVLIVALAAQLWWTVASMTILLVLQVNDVVRQRRGR